MPCVDMSLERLYDYKGINPKPADFDEFWERGLAEMNAIDPCPVLTPVDCRSKIADVYDLTFKSTKGVTVFAKFARPKNIDGKAPALLMFHGLSGASDSYMRMLSYASQGYCVANMDCRGQGGYSDDAGTPKGSTYSTPFARGLDGDPNDLYYRDVFLDTAMLARVVMAMDCVDRTRVGVRGGSQGGGLSIACAALVPEIKLCAPTYPYLSDYKRVWEMDLAKGAYEGLRYHFRYFDPMHEKEDEIFTKLGYIDIQHLAPRIKAKVLMATGLMDTTCPPSSQFAAFNKMTCEKEVKIYPDFGHERLQGFEDIEFNFFAEL